MAPPVRHVAYPDRTHRSCAEWQPGPVAAPDLGTRLARLMVRRAAGVRVDQIAREFNLSREQVLALFARHGEPPMFVGRDAIALSRATAPEPAAAAAAGG